MGVGVGGGVRRRHHSLQILTRVSSSRVFFLSLSSSTLLIPAISSHWLSSFRFVLLHFSFFHFSLPFSSCLSFHSIFSLLRVVFLFLPYIFSIFFPFHSVFTLFSLTPPSCFPFYSLLLSFTFTLFSFSSLFSPVFLHAFFISPTYSLSFLLPFTPPHILFFFPFLSLPSSFPSHFPYPFHYSTFHGSYPYLLSSLA